MHFRRRTPWNWLSPENESRNLPTQRGLFASADDLHNVVDRLFDSALNGFWPAERRVGETGLMQGMFTPKLDVKTTDGEYAITAELPGVTEKDVSLDLDGRTLILSGEKKEEHEDKKEGEKGYYRMERSYGSFRRMLALPDDADVDGVKAEFKDGVLKVTLPRKALPGEGKKNIAISKA